MRYEFKSTEEIDDFIMNAKSPAYSKMENLVEAYKKYNPQLVEKIGEEELNKIVKEVTDVTWSATADYLLDFFFPPVKEINTTEN